MITVYSKPNCMQCTFTKKWLEDNNIPFVEVDVTQDEVALKMLKLHKYNAVPVVAIDGFKQHWYGFAPDKLEGLK